MKKILKKNYLNFIPKVNPDFTWKENEKHLVVVSCENKGFYNKMAQKFFNKPKVSSIELDELGSFIWKKINGRNSIYMIADSVKAEFGKKAEPLYDRLVKFFQILYNNKFILYV